MTATLSDHYALSDAPFLASIADDIAADGPRLVYADWLEERGDPRGEFIRIQCELAPWENKDSTFEPTHLPDLRTRETELLKAYGEEWTAKVATVLRFQIYECGGKVPGLSWLWRRGFIYEVTLPTAAALVGGLCRLCHGSCRVPTGHDTDNHCYACRDGRGPGCAAALGRAVPTLERVVLSDRQPHWPQNQKHMWHRGDRVDHRPPRRRAAAAAQRGPHRYGLHPPSDLPEMIFDLLEDGDRYERRTTYATSSDALDALAVAAAKFVRGMTC